MGIRDHFGILFGADLVNALKPARAYYERAFALAEVDPARALVLDDTPGVPRHRPRSRRSKPSSSASAHRFPATPPSPPSPPSPRCWSRWTDGKTAHPNPLQSQPVNEQGLAVTLEYCAQCGYLPRAQWMAGEILAALQDDIASFALIPGGGGCFEWAVDGEVISSKNATGRFPDVDEIMELIANRL